MTKGLYTGGNTDYQDRFAVYWGLVTGGNVNNQITLQSSVEWNFWRQVYQQYRVIGCKIKWIPDRVVGGGDQREWKDLHIASFATDAVVGFADVSPAIMIQKPDYKVTRTGTTTYKYIGVDKFEKRLNKVRYNNVGEDNSQGWTGFCGRDFNFADNS